ncbi:hypothetical protein [Bacillus infantis]|uniref:Lipoprotein n=1 Tax=Bacillus infantis TaxID=324767 RepID=A0A5D4RKS5_9BACI|nr:hypothetical protein [Bacillus infantis]TYS50961.1 hypothetical protein FZD51_02645 [Bacillus infantis]
MKKILSAIMLILVLLMASCSKTDFEDGSLIHDEQTQSADQLSKAVEVAYSEKEFAELGRIFNFEKELPSVDFEKSAILIAQTMENSCPKEIEKLELDKAGEYLIIETVQKENTCNDIGIPRTFVFKLDKEKLEKVEMVMFEGEEFTLED